MKKAITLFVAIMMIATTLTGCGGSDDTIQTAFKVLGQDGKPTEQQKDRMLDHILLECNEEKAFGIGRLKEFIIAYPWRFAFSASAVQC